MSETRFLRTGRFAMTRPPAVGLRAGRRFSGASRASRWRPATAPLLTV